jgi:hypothetical protein
VKEWNEGNVKRGEIKGEVMENAKNREYLID